MDIFVNQCVAYRVPSWVAPLLYCASRLKSDKARRKKAYKLIQRNLLYHKVGLKEEDTVQPTYVYSAEVKQLIRNAFPEDICDYPDPCHEQVVYVTLEDLQRVEHEHALKF